MTAKNRVTMDDPQEVLGLMEDRFCIIDDPLDSFNPLIRLLRSIGEKVFQDDEWLILKTNMGYFGLYMIDGRLSVYYAEDDAELTDLKKLASRFSMLNK